MRGNGQADADTPRGERPYPRPGAGQIKAAGRRASEARSAVGREDVRIEALARSGMSRLPAAPFIAQSSLLYEIGSPEAHQHFELGLELATAKGVWI